MLGATLPLSPGAALPALLCIALGIFVAYRIYAGISGPLAHLPGPMISLFTNLILKYHVVKGQRMHYVHQIHQQYGPIARISPYEVIISDPQAVREVHKFGSEFTKSIWYQKFVSMPVLPGFAMTGADEHRKRRQLQGSNMTETYLAKCEPLVREKVELAVDSMMKRVKDQGFVDVAAWWLYMAADIISLLSFGKAFGMLEMGQKNQFILDLENTGLKAGIGAELSWLIKLFERLHVPIFSEHGDMLARQRATADKAVRRLKERDEKDNQPSLFSKLWAKHGEGGLTDGEVAAEAQAYIVAGSDTTATTLTYLVWILSKHSDMEAKLIDEVRGRDADWSSHALKNLPYLNAVIEECLRLYGAAPGCLPRIVPGQGAELGGYFIPPGLTILTQSYTLHRDPNVFEDPERFDPERWLSASAAMRKTMMPFGWGSRACLGENLARMELRLAVAKFYQTFTNGVRMASTHGMKDEDMEMLQFFIIAPKGHRCLLEVASRA